MVDNIQPVYGENAMTRFQVSVLGKLRGYESSLKRGGPDVGHVFGAPNHYEGRTRFFGGQSDLIHNARYGNDLQDTILVIPDEEREAIQERELEALKEFGVTVQSPDRELYTTSDDWKSVRDISSGNDTIHGYTSDYHGVKTHLSGWISMDLFGDRDVHTFAFPTERSKRQNILKQNFFSQTVDTPRQLYNMARNDFDF